MPRGCNDQKTEPERTCAACREQAARGALVRWVRGEDGSVVPDLLGRAFGRGAWVHPRPACLKKLQAALQKSFKAPVTTSTADALSLLKQAAEHRTRQLLGQARRQSLLVFGADRTAQEWNRGSVHMVLVACDAKAAAESDFVGEATTRGMVRAWSNKAELGALFGRAEIGVLGVQDRGLAQRLFGAIAMALLVQEAPFGGKSSGQEIFVSSEVE